MKKSSFIIVFSLISLIFSGNIAATNAITTMLPRPTAVAIRQPDTIHSLLPVTTSGNTSLAQPIGVMLPSNTAQIRPNMPDIMQNPEDLSTALFTEAIKASSITTICTILDALSHKILATKELYDHFVNILATQNPLLYTQYLKTLETPLNAVSIQQKIQMALANAAKNSTTSAATLPINSIMAPGLAIPSQSIVTSAAE